MPGAWNETAWHRRNRAIPYPAAGKESGRYRRDRSLGEEAAPARSETRAPRFATRRATPIKLNGARERRESRVGMQRLLLSPSLPPRRRAADPRTAPFPSGNYARARIDRLVTRCYSFAPCLARRGIAGTVGQYSVGDTAGRPLAFAPRRSARRTGESVVSARSHLRGRASRTRTSRRRRRLDGRIGYIVARARRTWVPRRRRVRGGRYSRAYTSVYARAPRQYLERNENAFPRGGEVTGPDSVGRVASPSSRARARAHSPRTIKFTASAEDCFPLFLPTPGVRDLSLSSLLLQCSNDFL